MAARFASSCGSRWRRRNPPSNGPTLGRLNGPFSITRWEGGRRAVYAAEEDAPGGRPFVDNVDIQMALTRRERAIELGRADIVELAPNRAAAGDGTADLVELAGAGDRAGVRAEGRGRAGAGGAGAHGGPRGDSSRAAAASGRDLGSAAAAMGLGARVPVSRRCRTRLGRGASRPGCRRPRGR